MVGVPGQPVAEDLRVDLRSARAGVLVLLQNDDPGPLAHHEPVPVGVPRTRGALGIGRVLRAQRLAGIEARDADLADRTLGAAGHHDVRIVQRDQARRISDGVRAGRAGGDDRVVRSLEPVPDADLARDQVDERTGDEEGAHPLRTALLDEHSGLGNGGQTADARSDHHPGPQLRLVGQVGDARLLHRLLRGGHAVEDEVVDLAPLLRLHERVGIEGTVRAVTHRNLAGVCGCQRGGVEPGDRSGAGSALDQPRPCGADAGAQRADHAHSGDDNPPHPRPSPIHRTP